VRNLSAAFLFSLTLPPPSLISLTSLSFSHTLYILLPPAGLWITSLLPSASWTPPSTSSSRTRQVEPVRGRGMRSDGLMDPPAAMFPSKCPLPHPPLPLPMLTPPQGPALEHLCAQMATELNTTPESVQQKLLGLNESNPMMGLRGCRLGEGGSPAKSRLRDLLKR
jgi:hypothetical protein